jgi:hypothetical protein
MLIRRTEREARRGALAALASQSDRGLDRRSFLRRSGVAAGALAGLGALPLGNVRKARPGRRRHRVRRSLGARACALIAPSAAPSRPRSRTAFGSGKSRAGTARSIAARIARKAPRCANSSPASGGSNIHSSWSTANEPESTGTKR